MDQFDDVLPGGALWLGTVKRVRFPSGVPSGPIRAPMVGDLLDSSSECVGRIALVHQRKRTWKPFGGASPRLRHLFFIAGDSYEIRDLEDRRVRSIVSGTRAVEPVARITDDEDREVATLIVRPGPIWPRAEIEVSVQGKRVGTLPSGMGRIIDDGGARLARIRCNHWLGNGMRCDIKSDSVLQDPFASVAILAALCVWLGRPDD